MTSVVDKERNQAALRRPPLHRRVLATLAGARPRNPFDDPGRFEAVPNPDKLDPFVVHQLNWVPDVGTGWTVALWYTHRVTAQALVKLLNNGTP